MPQKKIGKMSKMGRCGPGMVHDPKSGKCIKKPNIKKILGKSINVGAREPIASAFGLEDRGLRSKSVKSRNIARRKKATATAKKRY